MYTERKRKGYKKMYEFEIVNINTNEHDFIYGYNTEDAWRRRKSMNAAEWKIIDKEYID